MKLEIGAESKILDTLGMMFSSGRYLGVGHKYSSNNGKQYYRTVEKYFVFELINNNGSCYKYAFCQPEYTSDTLEFSYFHVKRYGNNLSHAFVDFKQDYFHLGVEYSIDVDNFDLNYSKDKSNSGPEGSFI